MFEINTISKANPKLSQKIYQSFCLGSVINRKDYKASINDFVDCPLYQEIVQNLHHYETFYLHLGYSLKHDELGRYFFIKTTTTDEGEDEDFDEVSLRIIAILTIFSRLATSRGQQLQFFANSIQGITIDDIGEIDRQEESRSFLNAIKLKSAADAMDFLKKKGFAYKTATKKYILSEGAMSMINTLVDRQSALMSQLDS